jgi:PadR family transcriptional regulator PadR
MANSQNDFNQDDLAIVGAMLADSISWHFGLAAAGAAGIAAGNAYPAFARLERAGWLDSRWEEGTGEGPRRRLYRLTGLGQRLGSVAAEPTWKPKPRLRLGFGFPVRKESTA